MKKILTMIISLAFAGSIHAQDDTVSKNVPQALPTYLELDPAQIHLRDGGQWVALDYGAKPDSAPTISVIKTSNSIASTKLVLRLKAAIQNAQKSGSKIYFNVRDIVDDQMPIFVPKLKLAPEAIILVLKEELTKCLGACPDQKEGTKKRLSEQGIELEDSSH